MSLLMAKRGMAVVLLSEPLNEHVTIPDFQLASSHLITQLVAESLLELLLLFGGHRQLERLS
jgi:hypothetical protein